LRRVRPGSFYTMRLRIGSVHLRGAQGGPTASSEVLGRPLRRGPHAGYGRRDLASYEAQAFTAATTLWNVLSASGIETPANR